MDILDLMGAPFAECMVLVAIHTYLGIHVLKRRVIFVDLALAQIAALGTTVGFFFGILPETTAALVFSMAFTFVGAAIFAISRFRGEKVPQEAVIGLIYAITAATAVLVVEKTQGAEHLKDILVGSILWVTWEDVGIAATAYLFIGVIHYVFHKKFLLISNDPDKAYAEGLRVRAWDFLFYLTFGFVITFSTRVAGVLLVFVFLVAPAIMALMTTSRLLWQLLIGWGMGTIVTVVGLLLSYSIDLPSGPTVVAFYGVALVLGAIVLYLVRAEDLIRALSRVFVGVIVAGVTGLLLWQGARLLASSEMGVSLEQEHVVEDMHHDEEVVADRAECKARVERERLSTATGGCVGLGKIERYSSLKDSQARLEFVEQKLGESKRRGLGFLFIMLSDPDTPLFYRSEATDLLVKVTGQDFGYDPESEPKDNCDALKQICGHLTSLKRGD